MKKRGRKAATGRYETRAELVAAVWAWWDRPKIKQSDIARIERVSDGVVSKILKTPRPTGE